MEIRFDARPSIVIQESDYIISFLRLSRPLYIYNAAKIITRREYENNKIDEKIGSEEISILGQK